ncbi:MAG: hypothetical protein HXY50_05505, partial [Ignavibacteriaceae bacterium]|nr:hypothetical protein [Ignavibacteriaceae bacterium]
MYLFRSILSWWIWCISIILVIPQLPAMAQTEINQIGSFEQELPSYWKKGNEGGAKLTWATDHYRSMGRSLKIE